VIRKYGLIDGSPELVRSILIEAEDWPLWFPGVEKSAIVERSDDRFLVDIDGHYMGRRMHGRIECRLEAKALVQNQQFGWLKRWDTRWRFLTPPNGRGTTLACEVDLDLGFLGVVTPKRMIHSFVGRVFGDTVDQLNRRVRELQSEETAVDLAAAEDVPLLQLYETSAGLELWIAGRRYLLEPSE
jgi:ribosome-associated toxin RatA of RatAB toxin-antitoxin module